jgi:hypothetical protein
MNVVRKTYSSQHPTNPNVMLEFDVDEYHEPELVLSDDDDLHYGGNNNYDPPITVKKEKNDEPDFKTEPNKKRQDEEKSEKFEKKQKWEPSEEWILNQNAVNNKKYEYLREFVGMVADSMSIQANKLLKNSQKDWEHQWVVRKVFNDSVSVKTIDRQISTKDGYIYEVPDEDLPFLKQILSQETIGAFLHTHRSLILGSPNISLLDLIKSKTTNSNFAELVAAKSRQGAGGSAQLGQIWTGGGNAATSKMGYNVHAGIKHRELNNRDIRWLTTWFRFVYKKSPPQEGYLQHEDDLYWTPPSQLGPCFF